MATKSAAKQPEAAGVEETPVPTPDPKKAEPSIRVSTKDRDRPKIEIDGEQYEMRTMGDFGIGKQQQLNRDGREFGQLWTSDQELTDDQGKRLKFLLERLYADVVDAPKAVLRRLNDAEKADVVLNFTLAPLRQMMTAALAAQQDTEAAGSPSTTTT